MFREETYEVLREHGVTMAWSEIPYVDTPPVITASKIYLRLVGDRSIPEEKLGKTQRDRTAEISRWVERLKAAAPAIAEGVTFVNNHFQGFAPDTVNLVRKQLGLEPVNWFSSWKDPRSGSQNTLF